MSVPLPYPTSCPCLAADLDRETVNLACSDTTAAAALAERVPTDQARYHLFVFSHHYEGDLFHSLGELCVGGADGNRRIRWNRRLKYMWIWEGETVTK